MSGSQITAISMRDALKALAISGMLPFVTEMMARVITSDTMMNVYSCLGTAGELILLMYGESGMQIPP